MNEPDNICATRRIRRDGMVLPIVLACLLLVALIAAAMARTAIVQRRSARRAEQLQQAAWLADSAMQRAEWRLAGDPDYAGETWHVAAEQMPSGLAGAATIRIESADGDKRIVIEAVYPEHPLHRILQRRERNLESTSPGGSS